MPPVQGSATSPASASASASTASKLGDNKRAYGDIDPAISSSQPLSIWAKLILIPWNLYCILVCTYLFSWFIWDRGGDPSASYGFHFLDRKAAGGPVLWLIGGPNDLKPTTLATAASTLTATAWAVLAGRMCVNFLLVCGFGFAHHFFARLSVRRALRRGIICRRPRATASASASSSSYRLEFYRRADPTNDGTPAVEYDVLFHACVHRQVTRAVFICVTAVAWIVVVLFWQPLEFTVWNVTPFVERAALELGITITGFFDAKNLQQRLSGLISIAVWWTVYVHSVGKFLGISQLVYGFDASDEADVDAMDDHITASDNNAGCAFAPNSLPSNHKPVAATATTADCPATAGAATAAAGVLPPPKLITTGIYGWVRHPMYFFLLCLPVVCPLLSLDRVVWALAAVSFLVVALPYEEAKLIVLFGEPYRVYQRTTPAFIPLWPMPLSGDAAKRAMTQAQQSTDVGATKKQ